jgi:hypothetical protein
VGNCTSAGDISFEKGNKIRDLWGNRVLDGLWLIFDQPTESHGFKGPQLKANTLSTERPTDFGGNSVDKHPPLWKTLKSRVPRHLARPDRDKQKVLAIY